MQQSQCGSGDLAAAAAPQPLSPVARCGGGGGEARVWDLHVVRLFVWGGSYRCGQADPTEPALACLARARALL